MRRIGLVVVLLLALVAGGCGGGDDSAASSADEWADSFCTSVSSWIDELERIQDGLGDISSLTVEALEEAGQDAREATDAFLEELRALGAPETDSGQEVEDSVESFADTVEAEKGEVEDAIDGVSDVTDLPGAIATVGTSITAMGEALDQAVQAIEDADPGGELQTALEESPACDEVPGFR